MQAENLNVGLEALDTCYGHASATSLNRQDGLADTIHLRLPIFPEIIVRI